jgi:hypothetical protein
VIPGRRRRRMLVAAMALAASVSFISWTARYGLWTNRPSVPIPSDPLRSSAGASVPVAAPASPRLPRPPLEVELHRWANEASPGREEAARVVLSRVVSLPGRSTSREIFALELANSTPGSDVKFPMSIVPHATSTPGSIHRPLPLRRVRSSSSPRA